MTIHDPKSVYNQTHGAVLPQPPAQQQPAQRVWVYHTVEVRQQPTNKAAVASLIFALLWIFGLGSILAVILGGQAQAKIKTSHEQGDGVAFAGVLLGWLGLAPFALFLLLVLF